MFPWLLVIIVIFRIVTLALFAIYLLNNWKSSEYHNYKDFKFQFFVVFLSQSIAKIIDLVIYINTIDDLSKLQDPHLLWFIKFRYLIILGIIFPVFYMMIFIWFNKDRKIRLWINLIFYSSASLLVLLAPNYDFLVRILSIMTLPIMILSSITFITVYLHKRLPEFNSLLMAISLISLLIAQFIRPILATKVIGNSLGLWIIELIEGIIWIMMGFSFIIKPKFSKAELEKVILI